MSPAHQPRFWRPGGTGKSTISERRRRPQSPKLGGIVVTDDASLCERLHALKDQGRTVQGTGGDDLHPTIGFNFKFTNLQAAFGLAQLAVLEERIESQKRIYREYLVGLAGLGPVRLFPCAVDEGEVPQWTDVEANQRDELATRLGAQGIGCRRFWFRFTPKSPISSPAGGSRSPPASLPAPFGSPRHSS